jgi:hypothetical protein
MAVSVDTMTADYELLGLSPGASVDQVKSAFRTLSRRHHPDAGGTHERFIALQGAYERILSGEYADEPSSHGQFEEAPGATVREPSGSTRGHRGWTGSESRPLSTRVTMVRLGLALFTAHQLMVSSMPWILKTPLSVGGLLLVPGFRTRNRGRSAGS